MNRCEMRRKIREYVKAALDQCRSELENVLSELDSEEELFEQERVEKEKEF